MASHKWHKMANPSLWRWLFFFVFPFRYRFIYFIHLCLYKRVFVINSNSNERVLLLLLLIKTVFFFFNVRSITSKYLSIAFVWCKCEIVIFLASRFSLLFYFFVQFVEHLFGCTNYPFFVHLCVFVVVVAFVSVLEKFSCYHNALSAVLR